VLFRSLAIETNWYDDDAIVQQKLGRLGRYGVTRDDTFLTYFVDRMPEKVKVRDIRTIKKKNRKA
jgi:hypothetical protein